MRRRRGTIVTILGLILATATGALVYYLLVQATPPPTDVVVAPTAIPVETRPIPVAARELTAGTTLTTTDIVERQYPLELVPVGVLTDTSALVGQALIEPLLPGEFFRATQLRGGEGRPLSEQIEPEMVAMAFTREDLLNRSRVIQEGDFIDLLLTMDIEEESLTETRSGKSTSYTLQNLRVLRLIRDQPSEGTPNPEPVAIIFEMTPQDAVIAKFVKDSGGTMDFTLRAENDPEPYTAEAITQDFLFDNYGFHAPLSSTRPKE